MQAHSTKLDLRVLGISGSLLFILAAVFLWQDLMVPAAALAGVFAAVVALFSMSRLDRKLPLAAPILMVLIAAGTGLWYAAVRDPLLLAPLGVTFLASLGMVAREPSEAKDVPLQIRRVLVWYGMVLATVAASWAAHFQFVILRFPGAGELPLLLTGAWMAAGAALVLVARWRNVPAARDAGFAFLAAAVGKLVLYDTAHVYGLLRIAGLAGGGALLLAAAWLAARLAPREEVAS